MLVLASSVLLQEIGCFAAQGAKADTTLRLIYCIFKGRNFQKQKC